METPEKGAVLEFPGDCAVTKLLSPDFGKRLNSLGKYIYSYVTF
jgi:hypothetical protein